MTASSVRFLEAGPQDVPAMAKARVGDPLFGPPDERMGAYLEGVHHPSCALPPRVAYVAAAEDLVIGYVAGHLTTRFGCDGELQYLYVGPAHRRHGIGRELVRHLANWFAQRGAKRICVNVNVDSPSARPFYLRLGATDLRPFWMAWRDIQSAAQEIKT